MPRILIDWSTPDPDLAETLTLVNSSSGAMRQEMEAALHMMMARHCWAEADRLRRLERDADAREARRHARHGCRKPGSHRGEWECPTCGQRWRREKHDGGYRWRVYGEPRHT